MGDKYNLARQKFVSWVNSSDFDLEPLEFGTVKAPGLSDLDLAILVKDKQIEGKNLKFFLNTLPSSIKQIMNGGTLMVFHDVTRLHYIDDIDLHSIDGQNSPTLDKVDPSQRQLLDLIRLTEWLPERLMRINHEITNGMNNPIRLIGYLYSIRYNLMMISELSDSLSSDLSRLSDEIVQLRKITLEQGVIDHSFLRILSLKILSYGPNLIDTVARKWHDFVEFDEDLENTILRCGKRFEIIFGSDNFRIVSVDLFSKIFLPKEFIVSYYYYSQMKDSLLGKIIKTNMTYLGNAPYSLSAEAEKLLEMRGRALCEAFSYPKTLGLNAGAFKFGWYL
jgi:hypothetical protein